MPLRPALPLVTLAFLTSAFAAPVRPAAPDDAPEAAQCRRLDDPQARLDCYDRLHGREAPGAAQPQPQGSAPAASEQSTAPQQRAPQTAGRDAPKERPAPAASGAGAAQAPIVGRVAEIGETLTGRTWFRLDDGQVWQQVTPRRTAIEAGNTVRVMQTALGSWHLRRADGSSRSSRVRRVD